MATSQSAISPSPVLARTLYAPCAAAPLRRSASLAALTLALLAATAAHAAQIAAYPFNGNAQDVSGFGNHGTVQGATLATDRFGTPDSAYFFDDTDAITIADAPIFNATDGLSISVWITQDASAPTPRSIFSNMLEISPHFGYSLTLPKDNQLRFMSGEQSLFVDTPIPLHTWVHVVVTLSPWLLSPYAQASLYKNGELLDTTYVGRPIYSTPDPQAIGSASSGYYHWFGHIDDVQVFNHVLTPAEIHALYTIPEPATLSLLLVSALPLLRRNRGAHPSHTPRAPQN